ncbi:hypothetical protein BKA63DRAFT_268558 [Paraphoma chrysanthemicola]|nr:hypothetical protein BKA63DRAFT_268558 [Paraphoma chrysanthemicola]
MVLRLFIPPGEGQHKLVPKRPDPLGANATLQYSVIGSTALAATYTSFASAWRQRVTPSQPVSRTALFIRSSARLGLFAGVVGAAVNYYYYSAFVGVVFADKGLKLKSWRLYKWTKRRTVDDGCLAGAALGLAASIPTLFMRRPAIPRWTRCLGMTNIGACAGLLGAHGYLQYTGERQRAYVRLDRRLKRKSLEFWAIFWDKPLMAKFSPLVQQYVRHNGLWYTSNMPETVFEQPEEYVGQAATKASGSKTDAETSAPSPTEPLEEELPFYTQPFDYAEDLKKIDVESTIDKMAELEEEKEALLREGEYILWVSAHKEYRYCHTKFTDDDERLRLLQQIMLCQVAYNRTRTAACAIDNRLAQWRMSLQHKAVTEAHPDGNDALEAWLPPSSARSSYVEHDPTLAMQEVEQFQTTIAAEVKRFEQLVDDHGCTKEKRERWRKDLEDGRSLLRAADGIMWEFEKAKKGLDSRRLEMEGTTAGDASVKLAGNNRGSATDAGAEQADREISSDESRNEQSGRDATPAKNSSEEDARRERAEVDKAKSRKPSGGPLEADKP